MCHTWVTTRKSSYAANCIVIMKDIFFSPWQQKSMSFHMCDMYHFVWLNFSEWVAGEELFRLLNKVLKCDCSFVRLCVRYERRGGLMSECRNHWTGRSWISQAVGVKYESPFWDMWLLLCLLFLSFLLESSPQKHIFSYLIKLC